MAGLADDELKEAIRQVKMTKLTSYTIDDKRKLHAAIEKVRKDSFAIVDQELELGLLALAVPIRAPSGAVLVALGVSVSAGRISPEHLMKRVLPVLRRSSAHITRGLSDLKYVHVHV